MFHVFHRMMAVLCAVALVGCNGGSGAASNTDAAAAGSIDMAAAKKRAAELNPDAPMGGGGATGGDTRKVDEKAEAKAKSN
ncbi:hypothetical protein Isop_0065 [Isosphaera pallida ATCC 43644]|uniref:Lipoprotein n=1 Tax=Isosphaera pallida (strain ATCC 43644 / DSM 9630 / IS1B) TaxID=575540 RepID=E8R5C1_ISOPI|nr:hypothetical protein [Isosphaera pallida]ADV60662.1 hypothetical protein Isop_0065 [Isosphaera pallida ATCC 43644]